MPLPDGIILTTPVYYYPSGFDLLAGIGGPIAALVTAVNYSTNKVSLIVFPDNRPPAPRQGVIHSSDSSGAEASYFTMPGEVGL